MSDFDPIEAEKLFLKAKERDGNKDRLYPWNKQVQQRLELGLAKASKLADEHRQKEADIEAVLKTQLLVSSLLMTPVLYVLSMFFLPAATCGECVGGFVIGGIFARMLMPM